MLHAVTDMVLQDGFLRLSQGGANGGKLRDNVDAIALFINHARNAAHLTLDLGQTFQTEIARRFLHT